MDWITAIISYFLVWWVLLFTVLPWGVEKEKDSEMGNDPGAPKNPLLKKKIIVTSVMSMVLLIVAYILIETFSLSFYNYMRDFN